MIAYIIDTFPKVSETFIIREINELQKRGTKIKILSLKPGIEGKVHSDAIPLIQDTTYVSSPFGLSTLASFCQYALCHPVRLLKCSAAPLFATAISFQSVYHGFRALLNATYFFRECQDVCHFHAHFAYVAADTAKMLSIMTGKSWSVSAHARDIFTQNSKSLSWRLNSADKIFLCTEHARDLILKTLPGLGEKLILMYHGLEIDSFQTTAGNDHRILSVGRLEEKKGFRDLIEACAILKSNDNDFQCHIIGDGPERKSLEEKISALSLDNEIVLTGPLSLEEVKKKYANSDVFVLTCKHAKDGDHDGLPNVILEALACGVPVVTTPIGGIGELIVHNETGLLVSPENPEQLSEAIQELFTIPDKRKQLAENGKNQVALKFDIKKTITPIYDYFKKILAN